MKGKLQCFIANYNVSLQITMFHCKLQCFIVIFSIKLEFLMVVWEQNYSQSW